MTTKLRARSSTLPNPTPAPAVSVPPPPVRPRKSKATTPVTQQNDTFQKIFSDIYRALLTIPSNPTLLCTTIFTLILVLTHNADLTTGFLSNLISGLEPSAALSIRTNAARIFGLISFIPVLMTRTTSSMVYITVAFGIFIAPPVNVYVYSFYSLVCFLFLSIRNSHTRWFLVVISAIFYFYFQSTVSSWQHPASILPSNTTARAFRG